MRVPFCLILGLLAALVIMDITTVWMVRSKITGAADIALDAALVGALREYDVKEGTSLIDERKGEELACRCLCENLGLDSRLENRFLQGTSLAVSFEQRGDKPCASIFLTTVIRAVSPRVLGLEGVPVTIRKQQYHISTYK